MTWTETFFWAGMLVALGATIVLLHSKLRPHPQAERSQPDWLSQARHKAVREYVAARWREDGRTDLVQRLEGNPDSEVLHLAYRKISASFASTFSMQNPEVRANMLAECQQRNGGNELLAMLELILERTKDELRFR